MKYPTLVILTLLVTCLKAQAQKIRYSDSTNRWSLTYDPTVSNFTYTQEYINDTVVNGFVYRQLNRHSDLWITEDTSQGKVFCTKDFTQPDIVLYDYNLKLGDTLISYDPNPTSFILSELDTVQINGYDHIVQSFSYSSSISADVVVIEGLGSIQGAFVLSSHHPYAVITCFENKGVRPPIISNVGLLNNTTSCLLMSVKEQELVSLAKVVPQPANEFAKLLFRTKITGKLTIADCLGRIIAQDAIDQAESVRLGKYLEQTGVYYYTVIDSQSGRSEIGKIIYNAY